MNTEGIGVLRNFEELQGQNRSFEHSENDVAQLFTEYARALTFSGEERCPANVW